MGINSVSNTVKVPSVCNNPSFHGVHIMTCQVQDTTRGKAPLPTPSTQAKHHSSCNQAERSRESRVDAGVVPRCTMPVCGNIRDRRTSRCPGEKCHGLLCCFRYQTWLEQHSQATEPLSATILMFSSGPAGLLHVRTFRQRFKFDTVVQSNETKFSVVQE